MREVTNTLHRPYRRPKKQLPLDGEEQDFQPSQRACSDFTDGDGNQFNVFFFPSFLPTERCVEE